MTILLLLTPVGQSIAGFTTIEEEEHSNSSYYGFLAPLVEYDNDTVETLVNSEIKHRVNDLLRENWYEYQVEKYM